VSPELEKALRGLDDAAEFARTYRFEMSAEYVALIARVEALPQNQTGADKSGRWRAAQTRRPSTHAPDSSLARIARCLADPIAHLVDDKAAAESQPHAGERANQKILREMTFGIVL